MEATGLQTRAALTEDAAGNAAPTPPPREADGGHPGSATPAPPEDIHIDPELAALLPPHTAEEKAGLEQSLLQEGVCRDALVVWKGHNILLEGHTRYELCRKHGIAFRLHELDLPNREAAFAWIIQNQLSRRNLSPDQASYLRGKRYLGAKQTHGGDRKGGGSSGHSDHMRTEEALAAEMSVSPRTVRRDGAYAEDVDRIAESCGPQARQAILSGEAGLNKKEVHELAEQQPEEQQQTLQKRAEQARQGKKASAGKTKASPATITIPTKPEEAARALVNKLGRAKAAKLHEALGNVLKEGEPAPEGGGTAARPKRRAGRKAKATPAP
jgi:hypothetical protein